MSDDNQGLRGTFQIPPGLTDILAQHGKVGTHAYDVYVWLVIQCNNSKTKKLKIHNNTMSKYFSWMGDQDINSALSLLQNLGAISKVSEVTSDSNLIVMQ